jgi:hypothetical protein
VPLIRKIITTLAVCLARDGDGRAMAFSIVRDRVWDLRFERQP